MSKTDGWTDGLCRDVWMLCKIKIHVDNRQKCTKWLSLTFPIVDFDAFDGLDCKSQPMFFAAHLRIRSDDWGLQI